MYYYYEVAVDLKSHDIFWTKKKLNYKTEVKMNKLFNTKEEDVSISDVFDVLTPSYYIMSLDSNKNLGQFKSVLSFSSSYIVKRLFLEKLKAKQLDFVDEKYLLFFADELNNFIDGYPIYTMK